jgi:KDO2-lipid IV(A) lauroyltransferase
MRFRWWREAFMLRSLWLLAGMLSPARASALGRHVMRAIGPHTAKHRHVRANLRIMCPERSRTEIEELSRQIWGSLGATLAEFIHLDALTDTASDTPAIEIVCENTDPDFLTRRKPCVFVAAHLGNWELSSWGIQQFGYPVDVIYKPQDNPRLDELVMPRRKRLGCGLVSTRNAVRNLMKSLKQGRSVGLHVDVRVEDAPLAPFAGLEAATTTMPAWLARKFECDIVPVHTERVGDARFRVTLHPSIPWRDAATGEPKSIEQLTAEMNDAIAGLIRRVPGQWLCTKRRWPKQAMRERGAYS